MANGRCFQLNFHASSHYNCNSAWSWNYTFTFKRLFHIDFPRNVCLPQLSALSLYDYMTLSENSGCNLSLFPFLKTLRSNEITIQIQPMYLRYRYTSTDKQDAILMFIYKFRLTKKVFEFMTSCTSGNKYSSEPHQLMLRLGLIPPKAEMLQPPCFTQSLHWLRNRRAFDGQTEMSLPV